MTWYMAVWRYVAGLVTLVGAGMACTLLPLPGLVMTFALAALIGGTSAWTWLGIRAAGQVLRVGCVTGAVVVATCGWAVVLGSAVVPLVIVLAMSAPPLVTRVWRALARASGGGGGVSTDAPAAAHPSRSELRAVASWSAEVTLTREGWMTQSPADMDSTTLCLAWRRSYLALDRPLSLLSRSLVVKRRQELLDELESRNPAGFAAWLDSGARAAGDPRRYIDSQRGEDSTR